MEDATALKAVGDGRVLELVRDGFAVPAQCACCLGPATIDDPVSVQKSAPSALTLLTIWFGHVAFSTETMSWSFPSCKACARHAGTHHGRFTWLFVLAFFSSIVVFVVLAAQGDTAVPDEELYTQCALYTVAIEVLVIGTLHVLIGRIAMLGAPEGCLGPRPAVTARFTWDSKVRFHFRNRAFAERLLEINRAPEPGASANDERPTTNSASGALEQGD